MSTIVDLSKKATVVLEKRGVTNPPKMAIGACLDVSGSMQDEYAAGLVQSAVDRLLGLTAKFDDDGSMEVWTFDHRCSRAPAATPAEIGSYVQARILRNDAVQKWGATSYAPPLQAVIDNYYRGTTETKKSGGVFGFFGKTETTHTAGEKIGTPALCLFITDGDSNDERAAEEVIKEAQGYPVYFQLIGVSNGSSFAFLRRMADKYPNVGYVHFKSLKLSDEELYEQLITQELANWVKKL